VASKSRNIFYALLSVSLFLCGCSQARKSGQADSEWVDPSGRAPLRRDAHAEIETLLNGLEKAVAAHDTLKVLEFLDPDYRQKEYEDLYQKHAQAFLNDFFCGKVVERLDQTQCMAFNEITAIKREKIEYGKPFVFANYFIQSASYSIRTRIKVNARVAVTYGVIGSRGYTQVE
jgi:hypothetical protein